MAKLIYFAMFDLARFEVELERDAEAMRQLPDIQPSASLVRDGVAQSFLVVVSALGVGGGLGYALGALSGPSNAVIGILGAVGAGLLLWGALALRGWEIQTWSNVTLTERVNRWIYRSLAWLGTAFIAAAGGISLFPTT